MNILTPTNIEELAEILANATADKQPVAPVGAGLHQHLGGIIAADMAQVQLGGMQHILEHAPADLIVQLEAGTLLADVQQLLGEHGQWLPWDPPAGGAATVGGLLAAGRSGPLRLGFGTPRDWLLGATVVLGDGRIAKSGGKVVKNVAGYDNHKLHIGALGTLGVLASVTFKVSPRPEQQATLGGSYATLRAACDTAEQLRNRPLNPVSLAIVFGAPVPWAVPIEAAHPVRCYVRSMGIAASVARHVQAAERLGLQQIEASQVPWQPIAELASPVGEETLILRAGVRPAALHEMLTTLETHAPPGHTTAAFPGVGLAYMRWPATNDLTSRIATLRRAFQPYDGYLVIEHMPLGLAENIDRWGPAPPGIALMQRLKASWDPANILNRGRYLVR
jgi:glycolate oxidase FAD binding subunit